MPEVRADLVLDTSSALNEVDALGNALDQALTGQSTTANVDLAVDTGGLASEIESALSSLNITITPNVETSQMQAEVEGAFAGITPPTITPTVDTGAMSSEVDAAFANISPPVITPEIDTSEAQNSVNDLADSLGKAGDAGTRGSEGISHFEGATGALEGVVGAAEGDIKGVSTAMSGVSGSAAAAIAPVAAVGVGLGILFEKGVGVESAFQRMDTVTKQFGATSSDLTHVKVGDLNTSLDDLSHKMGESTTDMQNAATNAFQFAASAGVASDKSSQFSAEVLTLSARAVALNPSLGSVADVANTLELRLASGGARLARYGIDLDQTSIKQLAMAETGKTNATQLTAGEKAVAAADLATQKYGNTLKESIDNASKNAEIQVRQLRAGLDDFLGDLGRPLVTPVLDTLKELLPVAESAGQVLGNLGTAILPTIAGVAGAVAPALSGIAAGLNAIPGPVEEAIVGFIALRAVLGGLSGSLAQGLIGTFHNLGTTLSEEGGAGLLAAEGMAKLAPVAAAAGLAVGVMGFESGNATESILGFTAAGAAVGTMIDPGLGTAIGTGVGLVVGLGAAFLSASDDASHLQIAASNLAKGATSENIPAMTNLIVATQGAAQADAQATRAFDESTRAANKSFESGTALEGMWKGLTTAQSEHQANTKAGVAIQDGFTEALKKSNAAGLDYIASAEAAGHDTTSFTEQLNLNIEAQKLHGEASAKTAVATDSLGVSFKTAAQAAGEEVSQQVELGNVGLQTLDSESKLAAAQDKLTTAKKSGKAADIEGAAAQVAAITQTNAYNEALLNTGNASTAATFAAGAVKNALQGIADSLPAGAAKDAIQGIIDRMTALGNANANPTVNVQAGDSITRIASIQKAIEDLKQNKPVDVVIRDLATGQAGLAQAAIDAIHQGAPPQVIIDDLASGKIHDIQSLTDDLKQHNIPTVSVEDRASAQLAGIQAAINAIQDKHITITAETVGLGGMVLPRGVMGGGPVGAGETVLVGEAGPEIVEFPAAANVVPNNRISDIGGNSNLDSAAAMLERAAMALAGGGGAPTIVVVRDWAEAQSMVPGMEKVDPSFLLGRS